MKHSSIRLVQFPVEFINVVPYNPLISKCQIKVCYIGEQPNRNRTVITKATAQDMANSLPGSPIVGFFNQNKQDFEGHERNIEIKDGQLTISDKTRPYGFVDLNAKVWFAKYLDDEEVEREYLVTEGWLWTGQYPECNSVVEQGKGQSMELDERFVNGSWAENDKENYSFFIINDAIISKLCILGDDVEPCFEGSNVGSSKVQFSLSEDFKSTMFSMMKKMETLLSQEGGVKRMFSKYSVTIGDDLWNSLYSHIEKTYPDNSNSFHSIYSIDSVCEEESQKFAVLQHSLDKKYYRLNFSFNDNEFKPAETLVEVTSSYEVDAENPQFKEEEVSSFAEQYAKEKKEANSSKKDNKETGKSTEDEKICPDCGKPLDKCTCKKNKKFSLEECPEYIELKSKYDTLNTEYTNLQSEYETLKNDNSSLLAFKLKVEKKEKEDMINSFYMLSDEDKKDVIDNINDYSLNDIEAKLSILCVRNKVDFSLNQKEEKIDTLNLNSLEGDDTPGWIKRALSVQEKINQ